MTIGEVLKNGNSVVNQKIKDKFIGIHVHACVTSMAECILNSDVNNPPFCGDDIENFYAYPEFSETLLGESLYFGGGSEDLYNEFKENFERLKDESKELNDDGKISDEMYLRNIELIEEKEYDFEQLESEPQEIFEYWILSSFLIDKLSQLGHPVIKSENIWGRCTTGQSIMLDYAITKICADMEILEGQDNSWA